MIKSILAVAMIAGIFSSAFAGATVCRKSAVHAARAAAPGYNRVFELVSFDETPDLISFDVTLADVIPNPNVTQTIEVTLNKATCSLIENPVKK